MKKHNALNFENFNKINEEFDQEKIDQLLDKINTEGEESLSQEEREYLKSGGEHDAPEDQPQDMNEYVEFVTETLEDLMRKGDASPDLIEEALKKLSINRELWERFVSAATVYSMAIDSYHSGFEQE